MITGPFFATTTKIFSTNKTQLNLPLLPLLHLLPLLPQLPLLSLSKNRHSTKVGSGLGLRLEGATVHRLCHGQVFCSHPNHPP